MSKIESYLDKIVEKGNKEDMEKVSELFIELVDYIKEDNSRLYKEVCTELYELANGKVISEEMAEEWVESMIPKARWTEEETTAAMNNMGYQFNPIEFYVVANMMYSDNYNDVKDNETMALKLASNWLKDEDVKENKLYNYKKYVVDEIEV